MPLNTKQQRFAEEYIVDLNATQAAIRAGYSERTAGSQGFDLLKKPEIQAAIAQAKQERSERTQITADDVLLHWSKLAMADPNELTSVIVGSCRFCHGTDHQYQWRDEGEFKEAQEAHFDLPDNERATRIAPVIGGGFGYKWRTAPHRDCPRCDGMGRSRTVIRDTTELSPAARTLFAGVKETQHGVEIKMHDQAAAVVNLAKHLGMFPNKVEVSGRDGKPIETINTNMTPQEAAEAYASTLGSDEG